MKVEENTSTFIRKLQEGDTETWQQFDQQYRQKMLTYLLKMGVSAEDAEDIYHEALVKVCSGLMNLMKRGILIDGYAE